MAKVEFEEGFRFGIKGEVQANWTTLLSIVETVLDPDGEVEQWYSMLQDLGADTKEEYRTWLGFKRAPAAKGNHHAFEGGLVYHLLEMWTFWHRIRDIASYPDYVGDKQVLRGIIGHDLHKAHRTYCLLNADPWSTDYGKDDTDMLMTETIKTIWLLNRAKIYISPGLYNTICWSHGGFSEIRPQWTSVLAKTVYLLDELSGNVASRVETKTLLNHRLPIK